MTKTMKAWIMLAQDAINPFESLENFLTNSVFSGLLSLVTPLAAIGIVVSALGMYLSTEEHNRDKFKKALISTIIITIICFIAKGMILWLESQFK
jgi:hypothetical protein